MKKHFEKIYATNAWGHGSGAGSLPRHTGGYARMLQMFMARNRIKTVLDLGCGDWQFSRFIDWQGLDYLGLDLVSEVIEKNQLLYSASNIRFECFSGDFEQLPNADLLIAKDVLQHWSNNSIVQFLPRLQDYPYNLITNCIDPKKETVNKDIDDGGFRHLDLRQKPFSLDCESLYEFTNQRPGWLKLVKRVRWKKHVLLIRGQQNDVASAKQEDNHRTCRES